MPALSNQRHERFAQELAKGSSQIDAYVEAGYGRSEGAASRLSRNVKIEVRVKELVSKGAERAEISIASLNERLIRLADKAEKIGDASGIQASRACVADIAKLNGMIIDKGENTNSSALTVTYVNAPPGTTPEPSEEDYETGA